MLKCMKNLATNMPLAILFKIDVNPHVTSHGNKLGLGGL